VPRGSVAPSERSYWITTLGCPKNDVDSAKLAGRLTASGYGEASGPEEADLIVVNTCAFIQPAREESIDTILTLSEARRPGARLAVTGCLAERSGDELAEAMPEIDIVAGFGMELTGNGRPSRVAFRPRSDVPSFDLLELPRPPAEAPWGYVKVAEGCDRRCGFCAIPSFRGRQRSRQLASILAEVETLDVSEVVLVAQDLASYGRDRSSEGPARTDGILELVSAVAKRVPWVRLLYLYPSSLNDPLIEAILSTEVPYFDLSLQHVSAPLVRRMRRWGSRERFLERIERIRGLQPEAVLRSSFILGYPGETEEDHDALLGFLDEAQLDWAGFFTFSLEAGTYAEGLDASLSVPSSLALERLAECSEMQDAITARRRRALVGTEMTVLVEEGGVGRSYREAPEIDGVVRLESLPNDPANERAPFVRARAVGSQGPDLIAEVIHG
jgi:ribosomal protein S12 methylthiotransferase